MADQKEPPFKDDPFIEKNKWTITWFEWLRDLPERVNEKLLLSGSSTEGNLLRFTTNDNVEDAGTSAMNPVFDSFGATARRITKSDSPYTIVDDDYRVLADTDTGAIAITMPTGVSGRQLILCNVGSSDNAVTVTGTIYGDASFTLYDNENINIGYETTEGWW
ncbi:MAG: hypothetical protein GY861_02795 [bacterium]|nr:hypothetical protein [bacterium]